MSFIYVLYIFIVLMQEPCYSFNKNMRDINQVNLHCRDNTDGRVDWWYIYKPPTSTGPYFESGGNFTYITSKEVGRWRASGVHINSLSMLQLTLAPLYRKNQNKLAVMSYKERTQDVFQKSLAFGIMFANSKGGIWITHTIPDFPDFSEHLPKFPQRHYKAGHMIMCLSVNLLTLDVMAGALKHSRPKITRLTVPNHLKNTLSQWTNVQPAVAVDNAFSNKIVLFNFVTKEKTVRGAIMSRSPGDNRCLYKTFAKMRGTVIDVYSKARRNQRPICEKTYSLRNIDAISLKFPEQEVHYIDNSTDNMNFGVSTGAVWQRSGKTANQYWACVGNADTSSKNGAIITCVDDYHIWLTFDNLKIKEPTC